MKRKLAQINVEFTDKSGYVSDDIEGFIQDLKEFIKKQNQGVVYARFVLKENK